MAVVGSVGSGLTSAPSTRGGLGVESVPVRVVLRLALPLCCENGKRGLPMFADICRAGVVVLSCSPAEASRKIFAIFVLWLRLFAERERSGV